MAKKNNNEEQGTKIKDQAGNTEIFDLNELWTMKFRDPLTGEICMVRKAFKPRGKLEFYHPEM